MPLKGGKSRKTVSDNIKTLIHEYEQEGRLSNSHPKNKKAAQKQAVAISLKKAGMSKYQRGEHRIEFYAGAEATNKVAFISTNHKCKCKCNRFS